MKGKKQYYLMVSIVFSVLLLLNGILFYSTKCSGEYLQSENVWGVSQSVKASDYRKRQQIIEGLPEDTETAIAQLQARLINLSPWEEETREDYYNYADVQNLVKNVAQYDDYIHGIEESVTNIAQALYPLYEDAWVLKNIAQCERDYYGLEYLQLEITMDNTMNMVLSYHVTDIMAFLMIALLAIGLCSYLKNDSFGEDRGTKRIIGGTLGLMALGAVGMYLTNVCVVGCVYGFPSLAAPVQSLNEFYTCPYNVTIGGFFAIYVLCKVLTLFILLALCFLAFTSRHRVLSSLVTAVVLGFEFWRCMIPADTAGEEILQELNLFSGFTVERFFNRYLNLNLAEHMIPRGSAFAVLFVITFAVTLFLVYKRFGRWHKTSRQEVMNTYFTEIDRRYQETRMLWHDFNNHLLAIKALYENGREEQAAKYIDDLSEQSHEWLLPTKTGSDTLDLMLFKKHEQAHESGIKLQFRIGCNLAETTITDYDLCSLFGNILDNAMEAVRKQKSTEGGIVLRVEKQNSMLFISCENPYEGELAKQDGELKTTKKDTAKHGIGLFSVRQVCRKYKGSMEVETEDGLFRISILLNL